MCHGEHHRNGQCTYNTANGKVCCLAVDGHHQILRVRISSVSQGKKVELKEK